MTRSSLSPLGLRAQCDARDMPSFIRYSAVAPFVPPKCVNSRIIREVQLGLKNLFFLLVLLHRISEHPTDDSWASLSENSSYLLRKENDKKHIEREIVPWHSDSNRESHHTRLTYLHVMICLIRVLFIFDEEKQTMMLLNKTSTCSFLKDQYSPRRNLFDEFVPTSLVRSKPEWMSTTTTTTTKRRSSARKENFPLEKWSSHNLFADLIVFPRVTWIGFWRDSFFSNICCFLFALA